MSEHETKAGATHAGRIAELWYVPRNGADESERESRVYRPAVLIDCRVNFRSLKAGINHSDERPYTAWLPERDLPVDWDVPAVVGLPDGRVVDRPDPDVLPGTPVPLSEERFAEIESDLVDALVRRERLILLHNPRFQLFSGIDESRDDFLARTGEAALASLEPELKQLKQTFELRLEQIREAQARQPRADVESGLSDTGESKADIERLLIKRTEFFEAEHRLSALFTGMAGLVFSMPSLRARNRQELVGATAELHEDLLRLEQEASTALNDLYTRYLEMVRSYDEFAIGIQPNNVRPLRRALLWVPVASSPS